MNEGARCGSLDGPARAAMADVGSSSAPEQHVEPAPAEGPRTLTALVVVAATIAVLYFAKDVLLPVILAVLLSFVLSPLVRILRKLAVPRVIAVVFSVGLALAIMGALATLVGTEIVDVARNLPRYQYTIDQKIAKIRSATVERIVQLSPRLHVVVNRANGQYPATAPPSGWSLTATARSGRGTRAAARAVANGRKSRAPYFIAFAVPRLVEVIAGVEQALDPQSAAAPLLDLVEVAAVGIERIIGLLVGPAAHRGLPRFAPQSSLRLARQRWRRRKDSLTAARRCA